MGEAINTALDMIEERKNSYREHGIAYYRPVGVPHHRRRAERPLEAGRLARSDGRAAEGVQLLRRRRRGRQHGSALADLASASRCGCMGMKFAELFSWLSNSQQAVSRSSPGDEVPLMDPTTGPQGWAAV